MRMFRILMLLYLTLIYPAYALEPGTWGLSAFSEYSIPAGGLSEWFKPTAGYGIAIGKQTDKNWFMEGMLAYTRFDQENLDGYADGKVDLFLEHTGVILNARYMQKTYWIVRPYWNIGGGLFYWKGSRGRIEADDTIEPAIPLIEKRVLEEWNWGFRTGPGVEFLLSSGFTIDINMYYRFIVGDLWPTLQPNIELEGVSGFQSINLFVATHVYF